MSKIKKTFTIDEDVWERFNEISKEMSLNKSLNIENHMKDVINKFDNIIKEVEELNKKYE